MSPQPQRAICTQAAFKLHAKRAQRDVPAMLLYRRPVSISENLELSFPIYNCIPTGPARLTLCMHRTSSDAVYGLYSLSLLARSKLSQLGKAGAGSRTVIKTEGDKFFVRGITQLLLQKKAGPGGDLDGKVKLSEANAKVEKRAHRHQLKS